MHFLRFILALPGALIASVLVYFVAILLMSVAEFLGYGGELIRFGDWTLSMLIQIVFASCLGGVAYMFVGNYILPSHKKAGCTVLYAVGIIGLILSAIWSWNNVDGIMCANNIASCAFYFIGGTFGLINIFREEINNSANNLANKKTERL